MKAPIIDAHCDVLMKLYLNPQLDFYQDSRELDASYPKLQQAGVKVQFFAIYIPEKVANPSFEHVLQFVDLFHRRVIQRDWMRFVKSAQDLEAVMRGDAMGALLTLEGADALMGDLTNLRILFYLGVRCIGITWNYANWAADGIMEPRKGGFTIKGKKMLAEMQRLGMLVDVSHLSVRGFWEVVEETTRPFMASHSNARALCAHPRNLSDDQIRAIIGRQGLIGVTFVPFFVSSQSPVQVDDVLRHIDHIASLGGERNIGFGSDFDGINEWIEGLENAGKYDRLLNALCRHYQEEQVKRFLSGNWERFLKSNLPPL